MKTKLKMVEDNNEVVCDRVFDYSVVIRKGYYGIIDKDGSVIVPFDYHYNDIKHIGIPLFFRKFAG